MPLRDQDKRQIAQFWLIAGEYLRLGADAASNTADTFGMTKKEFIPSTAVTEETKKLAILSAHLSSAAIRLASIDGEK